MSFKVLLIGDVFLDENVYGEVHRISPDGPVPLMKIRKTEYALGGAGNVANNLASLGLSTTILNYIPDHDFADKKIRELIDIAGIKLFPLDTQPGSILSKEEKELFTSLPTIVKSRYRSLPRGHLLLRVDKEESLETIRRHRKGIFNLLIKKLQEKTPKGGLNFDAIVLSDYGKGTFTDLDFSTDSLYELIKEKNIPVFVDTRNHNPSALFKNAFCAKPNFCEFLSWWERRGEDNEENFSFLNRMTEITYTLNLFKNNIPLERVMDEDTFNWWYNFKKRKDYLFKNLPYQMMVFSRFYHIKHLVVTLGEYGIIKCSPLEKENSFSIIHSPCPPSSKIQDTIGGGDTVLATLVASFLWGYDLNTRDPYDLANRAASLVCEKEGTVPVTKEDLSPYLEPGKEVWKII
jgi:D-beta-D-heptose 7-phosphate kinase/D-beta-D-heptose 1-phosphate adenosyltransferase